MNFEDLYNIEGNSEAFALLKLHVDEYNLRNYDGDILLSTMNSAGFYVNAEVLFYVDGFGVQLPFKLPEPVDCQDAELIERTINEIDKLMREFVNKILNTTTGE